LPAVENDFAAAGLLADERRHFLRLFEVGHHVADADIGIPFFQFLNKLRQGWKIENDRRHVDVLSQEIETETGMVKPIGEYPLYPCHLIVKEFHEILFSPIFVVDRIRTKHRREQKFRMTCHLFALT
jgi:hypothetical protein